MLVELTHILRGFSNSKKIERVEKAEINKKYKYKLFRLFLRYLRDIFFRFKMSIYSRYTSQTEELPPPV